MPHFFLAMEQPPKITAQERKVTVIQGKPVFYDPPELHNAKMNLISRLYKHHPMQRIENKPIRLVVKWCFPVTQGHRDGEYMTAKPDTDNLQKMLKDCMTICQFWKDDAQVVSETCEKFYSVTTGIYIEYEVII